MKGAGLSRRGTFQRQSGPPHDPERRHLHIICTNEDRFGTLLVVPMCSLEAYTRDRACLLGVGDHPFIKRRSFIDYSKSEILDVSALQESLRRGDISPDDDCSEEMLEQICHGLLASKATRPKKADYYRASLKAFPEAA